MPSSQPMSPQGLGLLPRVLGLEAELHTMRDKCLRLEMECKILHEHVRELEDTRREDRALMEELRVQLSAIKKQRSVASAELADGGQGAHQQQPQQSQQQPQSQQQKAKNKRGGQEVFFRERESVVEIDNCITGEQAAKLMEYASGLRSVNNRVPTSYVTGGAVEQHAQSNANEESDSDDSESEDVVSPQQKERGVKGRVPTGFVHQTPAVEDDDHRVRIDPNATGGRGGKKKRVPTAFVRPGAVPAAEAEGDEEVENAGGHVRFSGEAKQRCERNTAKRRVPTAFVKGPQAQEEDDSEGRQEHGDGKSRTVRIECAGGAGNRCTTKRRVPTAFVPSGQAQEDDDDDGEGEAEQDGRTVTFQPGAVAAEGKAKKKIRVPTAFVANAPAAEEVGDDADAGGKNVSFQTGTVSNEGRQKKIRVPTAFVASPQGLEVEDDEEDATGKSVTFQAGATSNEGKSKKIRVPTAFLPNARSPAEEDEDETAAKGVTFESGTIANEGRTKKKMRIPTAFVMNAPGPEDEEEEESGEERGDAKAVTFQPGVVANEGRTKKKMRVPTAFVVSAPGPDEDEEDEEAGEGQDDGKTVTFQPGTAANEGRSKKMRVPTAFVAKAPGPDEDEEDEEAEEGQGDGKTVTFQPGTAANEGRSKKMRVPTAFVAKAPGPDEDEEDEEDGEGQGDGKTVTFQPGTAANEGRDKKKIRVPTAFVSQAAAPDEEDDDEGGEEGLAKSVTFQPGTNAGEGSAKKKMRVPTAFVANAPGGSDGEEDGEEGAKSVTFQVAETANEGATKKKTRVPTAFVPGGPLSDSDEEGNNEFQSTDEDEEGEGDQGGGPRKKSVKFSTSSSLTEIHEGDGETATHRAIKRRVPTSFESRAAAMPTPGGRGRHDDDDDDDDEDDDGDEAKSDRTGTSRTSTTVSIRFSEFVDDEEGDEELMDRAHLRQTRGRIPTAFVRTTQLGIPGTNPEDSDQFSGSSPGRRERRERLPTALGRRTSEEFSEMCMSRTQSEVDWSFHYSGDRPEFEPEVHKVPDATKDLELISQSLRSLHFFHDLGEEACARLAGELDVFELPSGTMIAQQGSTKGTHFFVVEDGNFEVTRDGKRVAHVSRGGLLGESVILLSGAQNATVCAKGVSRVYAMTGWRARMIFQEQYQDGNKEVIIALNEVLRSGDSCSLLHNLTQYQEHILYDAAKTQNFAAGEVIQLQGNMDTEIAHVLLKGTLSVAGLEEGKSKEIPRFALIGDVALLFGVVPYTVKCVGPVQTLVLTRDLLKKMFGDKLRDRLLRGRICDALTEHDTFAMLGVEQLQAASTIGTVLEVAPGEEVRKEKVNFMLGLFGDVEAQVLDANGSGEGQPRKISAALADSMGKERLMKGLGIWTLSVKNTTPTPARCVIWEELKLDAILSLGIVKRGESVWYPPEVDPLTGTPAASNTRIVRSPSMRIAVLHDDKVGALRKVFYLKTLSAEQLQLLADTLVVEYAGAGDVIFEQGSEGDEFFIIHNGLLEVSIGDKRIRTLGVGDYVGERALLMEEPRSATVTAKEDSELWKISATAFKNAIKGPILEYMKDRIAFQDTKVEIDSLKCMRVVGKGGFGVVKMVQSTRTQTRYALKCVSIQQAIDTKQQKNLVAERRILAELDHPFVIKFIRTFKSKQYVYFLMELVTGGELLDALQVLGLLTRKQAQFYIGSLVLALEFLHERRIAYLDLKGENCLIDSHGYLKIIDFGVAERVVDGKIFMTRGTCYYMAPEVILPVQGYTTTADLWSLGVNAFDFMTGEFPFANEITDPRHAQANNQILSEILNKSKKPLRFPNPKALDKATKTFIKGLLQACPQKRLGAGPEGYEEIKSHEFFVGFSWDGLLARQIEPPYKPRTEVYAEDSESPKSGQELRVVEDMVERNGSVRAVEDDEPSWLEEF